MGGKTEREEGMMTESRDQEGSLGSPRVEGIKGSGINCGREPIYGGQPRVVEPVGRLLGDNVGMRMEGRRRRGGTIESPRGNTKGWTSHREDLWIVR
jgi:hypothetical protein